MDRDASRSQSLSGHADDWHLFGEAVDAVDYLLKHRGVEVRKALNPLVANDQVKISRRFAKALKTAAAGEEAKALKSAMNMLDVDWPNLSVQQRDRIITAARNRVKQMTVDNVLPKLSKTIKVTAQSTVESSKKKSIETHKLDIKPTFSKLDNDIVGLLTQSHANFITDEYGKRSDTFGKKVKKIVGKGLERGAGPKEIVDDIQSNVKDLNSIGRGAFYWEVVGLSFINRARTNAQISAFSEAGIDFYIWESVMDEVTTEPCRFMDGKRFSVGGAVKRIQQAESASKKSPVAVKAVQPWMSVGRDPDGNRIIYFKEPTGQRNTVAQVVESAVGKPDATGVFGGGLSTEVLQDRGLSMPPIHGLCRSTVVPDVSTPTNVPSLDTPATPKPLAPKPKPKKPKPKPPPTPQNPKPVTIEEKAQANLLAMPTTTTGMVGLKGTFTMGLSLPWSAKLNSLTAAQKQSISKTAPSVALKDLIVSKATVKPSDVQKIIQDPKKAFTPVFIKHNGKFYVQSGHAEVTAAKMFGDAKFFDAKLVDLDAFKPPPPPAKQPAAPVPAAKPKPGKKVKPTTRKPLKVSDLPTDKFPEGEITRLGRGTMETRLQKAGNAEKQAITAFTNGSYQAMRQTQWDPNAKRTMGGNYARAKQLADAAERGIRQAEPSPGQVFRGIKNVDQKVVDDLLSKPKFKLGSTSSTSRSSSTATSFMGGNRDAQPGQYKIMFRLQQKTGVAVEPISRYKREKEILMSKDAEFEITSVAIAEGRRNVLIIEATEVTKR